MQVLKNRNKDNPPHLMGQRYSNQDIIDIFYKYL